MKKGLASLVVRKRTREIRAKGMFFSTLSLGYHGNSDYATTWRGGGPIVAFIHCWQEQKPMPRFWKRARHHVHTTVQSHDQGFLNPTSTQPKGSYCTCIICTVDRRVHSRTAHVSKTLEPTDIHQGKGRCINSEVISQDTVSSCQHKSATEVYVVKDPPL